MRARPVFLPAFFVRDAAEVDFLDVADFPDAADFMDAGFVTAAAFAGRFEVLDLFVFAFASPFAAPCPFLA